VRWDNDDLIRYYEFNQSAKFQNFSYLHPKPAKPEELSLQMFERLLADKIQNSFNSFIDNASLMGFAPGSDCKILNIGSGASTLDLALSQYYSSAKFYLVDRSEYTLVDDSPLFTDNSQSLQTVFQNSWLPLENGIMSTRIDRSRFILLDPADAWPQDIDLIVSRWSWGWHYNYPPYIERLDSLKIGGIMWLTVLNLQPGLDDFLESISGKMNSRPVIKQFPFKMSSTPRSRKQFGDQIQDGAIYLWKKQ
jgi:hypothetical protein